MLFENPPQGTKEVIENLAPAVVGTAVSMLFTSGAWKIRLFQCAVGVPFSLLVAPSIFALSERYEWGLRPEATGVLTAVFGLALVSYAFELMRQLQLGPILNEWIRKKLGLKTDATPPAPGPDAG